MATKSKTAAGRVTGASKLEGWSRPHPMQLQATDSAAVIHARCLCVLIARLRQRGAAALGAPGPAPQDSCRRITPTDRILRKHSYLAQRSMASGKLLICPLRALVIDTSTVYSKALSRNTRYPLEKEMHRLPFDNLTGAVAKISRCYQHAYYTVYFQGCILNIFIAIHSYRMGHN